ncbi:DUF4179 domain-containing protein [Robertmurraya massiliosenegalensis]|uniref:DUF4179 domain-containing protein n=1 Tax=Robertmurraya TaxID=2837507 RepID=UPI0039A58128
MIPAKVDPTSANTISELGPESIVDWFEQHKQSFYSLGRFYLSTQQQLEELFYQSILKVQKGLSRMKKERSFETWATSIFIHTCWEISDDQNVTEEGERNPEINQALNRLKKFEKEAIILTYVNGSSKEDVGNLLQVPVEKINAYLFNGIQSLKKEMGYEASNGCKEYYPYYIDYLERTLERPKKIDLEKHVYHCQDCQKDLATFQDMMFMMKNITERLEDFHVPLDFMGNIKKKLAELENQKQIRNKKRKKIVFIMAGVFSFLLALGVFTGMFKNLYYTWTEDDVQLRAFLQEDLGERLDLVAENEGIKITIKSAISDDYQTLVFYEIEDMNEDNQYMLDSYNGVFLRTENASMNRGTNLSYNPPDLESDLNKEKKNVYHGKVSLDPISKDSGDVKLIITQVQKLVQNSDFMGMESKSGDWKFEFSITKHPSVEYALDEEIEVEGVPLRFEKLTLAPTTTILKYGLNTRSLEQRLNALTFDALEVNGEKMKADVYGSAYYGGVHGMGWDILEAYFDPLIGENLKELSVQLGLMQLWNEEQKVIELDASEEYPQTFEYAGSTISIDKVEIGHPTEVIISNHDIENREYDSFDFNILTNDENEFPAMEIDSEGVIIDKNGKQYDMNDPSLRYDEIEQPRFLQTEQTYRLRSQTNVGESVIPTKLEIYGYQTMKYLNEWVEIPVNQDK